MRGIVLVPVPSVKLKPDSWKKPSNKEEIKVFLLELNI